MVAAFLQLVPALPPPAEGVGTYALRLAAAGPGTGSFLAAGARSGTPVAGARVLPSLRAATLVSVLREAGDPPVVLHYVNYGYARRGCPWWLVRGLRRWRREAGRQLVTIFHEVRATGLPWQSSFWLSGMQLHLARQVARSSDHALTSMERYADLLAAGRGVRRPVVLPVFSAIGEPREVPPLPDRDRRIVVFGGRDVRSRAYRRSLAELASACRTIGAREVLDVGAGDASPPAEVAGRPIKLLGECPDDEVSDLLRSSYAGFLSYPPEFLPKSTIFAAYCAHGTLPICAPMGATVAPEAPPFARAASSADGHQELVVRCLRWYRGHSLSEHSRLLRQWVQDR